MQSKIRKAVADYTDTAEYSWEFVTGPEYAGPGTYHYLSHRRTKETICVHEHDGRIEVDPTPIFVEDAA